MIAPRSTETAVPRYAPATQADIDDAEAAVIEQGLDALRAVKQTFDRWMEVARALAIGRRHAMAEAQTDDTDDRGYRKAFGRWLAAHPPFDDPRVLSPMTRSWLLRCYDHEAEIVAWRKDKPLELTRYNYPEQAYKRWARVCRPELLTEQQRKGAGDNGRSRPSEERRRQSQAAAIEEAVAKLDHAADNLQGIAAGTQLTLDLSSPELINESAQMVIDIYGAAWGDGAVLAFAWQLQQLLAQREKPAKAPPTAIRLSREAAAEMVATADAGVRTALAWTERDGVIPVIIGTAQYLVHFMRDHAPSVEEVIQGVPRRVRKSRSVWQEAVRLAEIEDDLVEDDLEG